MKDHLELFIKVISMEADKGQKRKNFDIEKKLWNHTLESRKNFEIILWNREKIFEIALWNRTSKSRKNFEITVRNREKTLKSHFGIAKNLWNLWKTLDSHFGIALQNHEKTLKSRKNFEISGYVKVHIK